MKLRLAAENRQAGAPKDLPRAGRRRGERSRSTACSSSCGSSGFQCRRLTEPPRITSVPAGRSLSVSDDCRGALPAEHDLGCQRELGGTQAIDDDVRRVELDAQCEQLAVSQQLPDIDAHPPARRAGEHARVVVRAQLRPAQVQLGTVPSKRRRHRGEGDVISGLTVDPVLDLRLIPRERDRAQASPRAAAIRSVSRAPPP